MTHVSGYNTPIGMAVSVVDLRCFVFYSNQLCDVFTAVYGNHPNVYC